MTKQTLKRNINKEILVENAISIKDSTWIDVRCPREFTRGHYTHAINVPIFSNLEYKKLGTIREVNIMGIYILESISLK